MRKFTAVYPRQRIYQRVKDHYGFESRGNYAHVLSVYRERKMVRSFEILNAVYEHAYGRHFLDEVNSTVQHWST